MRKNRPSCALCETEIEEDQMICDNCWQKEKRDWIRKNKQ